MTLAMALKCCAKDSCRTASNNHHPFNGQNKSNKIHRVWIGF